MKCFPQQCLVYLFICSIVLPDLFFFLSAGPNEMTLYTCMPYDDLHIQFFHLYNWMLCHRKRGLHAKSVSPCFSQHCLVYLFVCSIVCPDLFFLSARLNVIELCTHIPYDNLPVCLTTLFNFVKHCRWPVISVQTDLDLHPQWHFPKIPSGSFLCPRIERSGGGHIVWPLSICLSAQT